MPNPNLPINFRKNTYIGARYVPKFSDTPGSEWDNSIQYEPLTIVLYQGNSYTSKTFVPVGADINNTTYWALTGNFNAQLQQAIEIVQNFNKLFTDITPETNVTFPVRTFFEAYQKSDAIRQQNLKTGYLRVATFNYLFSREWYDTEFYTQSWYDGLAKIAMLETGANILGMQEANSWFATPKSFGERLKNDNFENFYFGVAMDGEQTFPSITRVVQGRYFGEAMFAQMPLVNPSSTEIFALSVDNKLERRIVIHATFTHNGKAVSFYSTHFSHENQSAREQCMSALSQILLADNSPIIFCAGDFNINASDLKPLLPAGFQMANKSLNTYPHNAPTRAIDNIIYKGATKIDDGTVYTLATDHLLYWADFNIGG